MHAAVFVETFEDMTSIPVGIVISFIPAWVWQGDLDLR